MLSARWFSTFLVILLAMATGGASAQVASGNTYTIGGVDYQSFQSLDAAQLQRQHDYLPGATVPLRYDPHRPANSVVV